MTPRRARARPRDHEALAPRAPAAMNIGNTSPFEESSSHTPGFLLGSPIIVRAESTIDAFGVIARKKSRVVMALYAASRHRRARWRRRRAASRASAPNAARFRASARRQRHGLGEPHDALQRERVSADQRVLDAFGFEELGDPSDVLVRRRTPS